MATENQHQIPLDWRFMAAVIRQAENHEKSLTQQEIMVIERNVRNAEQAESRRSNTALLNKINEQGEAIQRFERETGLSISGRFAGLKNGQVAVAVGAISKGAKEATELLQNLEFMAGNIHRMIGEQLAAVAAMNAATRAD